MARNIGLIGLGVLLGLVSLLAGLVGLLPSLIASIGAFLIYPASPKLNINVNAGFLAVTDTGGMQKPTAYGAASVTGFESVPQTGAEPASCSSTRPSALLKPPSATGKSDGQKLVTVPLDSLAIVALDLLSVSVLGRVAFAR